MATTNEVRWAQDIAIVGMSCRFADDADSFPRFWDFICNGRYAFHYPGKKTNTSLPRGAHFFKDDIAEFDANFFNISKVEAESIDPQQRMVMETTFEALENAGITIDKVAGTRAGVWMANFTSDYREMLYRDSETAPMYTLSGASNTSTSNRVSWFFDLKGPSFTLNTACSSSMVATHLACQSLALGESSSAIVGGTSLLLNPDLFLFLSNQHFLAADGKSKAFDASGDGYGRGEGVAVVVLKRVADAIADGDPIRAVIRGTAINQDGRTKGMTLPSVDAQEQLIKDAYRNAGLSMKDTRYVEAHGTGTQAGDKCETEALSRTFSPYRTASERLILGSVKTNIGHLEACAGLASMIKCVGILEAGVIPPNPLYKKGNPGIKFDDWKLHVPTSSIQWPTSGLRRISTQGFGYGGTNAHIIMDDAHNYLVSRDITAIHNTCLLNLTNGTTYIEHKEAPRPRIFHFSAQDKDGLGRVRDATCQYLKSGALEAGKMRQNEDKYLRDLAYTLSERRSRLQWQTFAVASSVEGLIETLQTKPWASPETRSASKVPRIGFIFTGQGAQWPRMGIELMEYDIFRKSVERSDVYLREGLDCSWSAIEELAKPDSSSNLGAAEYSQALCSVLQIALIDLLDSWNIRPSAVAGHSSGEIAAAYCLGVLSWEDALKVAYFRGSLSAEMKGNDSSLNGAMMAVGSSPADIEKWLDKVTAGEVVVACVNSPASITLSGDAAGINELESMLKEAGIFARKLKVDTAYHSPHMQTIAGQYFEAIADISILPVRNGCQMHSSVRGGYIDPNELGAANWVRNLVSTVQFADAVHDLLRPLVYGERAAHNAVDILVEVGPHSALQGPVNQTMKAHGINSINYCTMLSRGKNAINTALSCAATLYVEGLAVDLRRANQDESFAVEPIFDMPSYPWNHSIRYWAESRVEKEYRQRKYPRTPLLGAPCPSMNAGEKVWRGFIRPSEEPWVRDHVIQGSILYPAAGFLAMAIEAARQGTETGRSIDGFRLRDVQINAALVIEENVEPEVILRLQPHRMGTLDAGSVSWQEFTVSSSTDGTDLRQNCSGLLAIDYEPAEGSSMHIEKIKEVETIKGKLVKAKEQCRAAINVDEFYAHLDTVGLTYGETFANLTEVHTNAATGECTGRLLVPDVESAIPPHMRERPHIIHPTTLDAIFHLAFAAISEHPFSLKSAMVPISITEVVISNEVPHRKGSQLEGFAQSSRFGFRELVTNINIFDEQLTDAVVKISGFRCADVSGSSQSTSSGEAAKPITFKEIHRPALELLDYEDLQRAVNANADEIASGIFEQDTSLDKSALAIVKRTLSNVPRSSVHKDLLGFYDWMQRQVSSADKASGAGQRDSTGYTNISVKDLEGILSGEKIAAQAMDENVILMPALTSSANFQQIMKKLSQYLLILQHTYPELSVLEIIHSAENSTTGSILPQLQSAEVILDTSKYTVLVQNEKAAKTVESQLGTLTDLISLEVSATDNSVQDHGRQYDLALVVNIAHKDPDVLLCEAKSSLKEGGRVCIIEIGEPLLNLGIGLAALQHTHFIISSQNTDESHLNRAGFTKELLLGDALPPKNEFRLIAGNTSKRLAVTIQGEIVIVQAPEPSKSAQNVADALTEVLEKQCVRAIRVDWSLPEYISVIEGKECIVLADLEKSHLLEASQEEFPIIQQTILKAGGILWVSGSIGPDAALVTGLARTIRNEIPGSKLRVLQTNELSLASPTTWSNYILRLLQSPTLDSEFTIKDGFLQISRVVEYYTRNDALAVSLGRQEPKTVHMPLSETSSPVKLCIKNPGMLDSLYFEPDDILNSPLASGQVEIEVKASGVNFRDVMVCMGQIPDSLLGFEAAGIVRRVGENVQNIKAGDRVCFIAHGSHRTVHRVRNEYVVHIPDEMSFAEASGVLLVHGTAWYGLVKIAQIKAGQTILIHAAAGGVGQAAVMLAQHFGLEIFATVGSDDKRQLIQDLYKIPEDHIFNSRDLSFAKGVLRMTNGRGVDVILNSLSGETLRQTWHCVAPFGTFIEIGIKDILSNTRLDMRPFLQDARFAFFNLNRIENERPDLMSEALNESMAFISSGATRPVSPLMNFPVSQVEDAFRLMQTGKHRGKLSLTYSSSDVVPIQSRPTRSIRLDETSAYVLVGGLGGLGRSLAQLFVRLGCKKLCFLSRSGGASEKAQKLLKDLQQQGVKTLALRCDVSDAQSVKAAINECATRLGPVLGVVQCAMVLRDGLFEKMTHQQWVEGTRPKVQGSWNLHVNLPNVDFFIILSSFAGIFGSRGQSNYTAAGAYEDALANYRRSLGLKAVTVDLGIMRDVGVLAEQGITDYLREWEEPCGIREAEFHALMENVLTSEVLGDQEPLPAHIPTGFATAKTVQQFGITTPFYFDDPRFSILSAAGSSKTGAGDSTDSNKAISVQNQIAQSISISEAASAVTNALVARVAKSLQSALSDIDPSRPLHAFGVDSLVAVEVVNWVFKEIKAKVTVFDVLSSIPITSLAEKIALKSSLLPQLT
ncbi:Nonribosomal peptide synthetase 14 [Talaromyces islandicus]|uniref:Nonribosomal peptide synthetase 14 n=1 Tax=Talaromyces islandicus TaxID=28573 RepID=A0A0U1MAK2_TALIS|nr:Nonribosomal peptide synthetase 14 [Talaromyces islandicus]